jgi:folate-binding protein YgfZ
VPVAVAAGLWGALVDAGARPAGLEALDVRRIEAGVPWSGTEITGEYFPIEAGLEVGWISYTKGCYLGQETIARVHHLGHVNRRLRGLLVEGEAAPQRGAALHSGGKRCGVVTSAARSPQLGRPVGLAYVHRDFAEPGTVLELGEDGTRHAEVRALPLA